MQKVVGLSKLRKKFKTFESLRQLRDSHSLILADDRILPSLTTALGSTFLRSNSKIPIPVCLAKNGKPASRAALDKEITRAVQCTYAHLPQGNSINIRVALARHSPDQIVENITAVLEAAVLAKKVIKAGWKAVKSVYIKSDTSAALPVYLSETLVLDETKDVVTLQYRHEQELKRDEKKAARLERKKERRQKKLERREKMSLRLGGEGALLPS